MKVILSMAITANGLVAAEHGDSSFTSDADWERFDELSKAAGVVVMGRATHEALLKENMFPFEGRLNVVMTKTPPRADADGESVLFTEEAPSAVLKILEEKGFDTAFIGGGAKLAGSFMKEGLVDEIYLTVEPVAFGKGIQLFRESDFRADLDLLDITRLSKNEIQLHYKVVK